MTSFMLRNFAEGWLTSAWSPWVMAKALVTDDGRRQGYDVNKVQPGIIRHRVDVVVAIGSDAELGREAPVLDNVESDKVVIAGEDFCQELG